MLGMVLPEEMGSWQCPQCCCSLSVKHSGSVTFDEIVNIARQMRHRSLARELSGESGLGVQGMLLHLLHTLGGRAQSWVVLAGNRQPQCLGRGEAQGVSSVLLGESRLSDLGKGLDVPW